MIYYMSLIIVVWFLPRGFEIWFFRYLIFVKIAVEFCETTLGGKEGKDFYKYIAQNNSLQFVHAINMWK